MGGMIETTFRAASRPSTTVRRRPTFSAGRPAPPPARIAELATRAARRLPLHGPDVPAGPDPPRLRGDPTDADVARLGRPGPK